MPASLLREITSEEIEAYERDGFVKLPAILPAAWVDNLRDTIDEMLGAKQISSEEFEAMEKAVVESGGNLLEDGKGRPNVRFKFTAPSELPLYIFCGKQLLCAKLRPANIDGSAGAVEELERSTRHSLCFLARAQQAPAAVHRR